MATPDFILRLREQIGTHPLWLSGTTAVVLREGADGPETLLVRRSDNGQWTPVAGIIDPGEHPYRAALREVGEEAGIRARVEKLAWVTVTDMITYDNGDRTQYIEHVFRCRWVAGEPRPDQEETTRAQFFPIHELPPMSRDHTERILAALDERPETRIGPYEAELPWSMGGDDPR